MAMRQVMKWKLLLFYCAQLELFSLLTIGRNRTVAQLMVESHEWGLHLSDLFSVIELPTVPAMVRAQLIRLVRCLHVDQDPNMRINLLRLARVLGKPLPTLARTLSNMANEAGTQQNRPTSQTSGKQGAKQGWDLLRRALIHQDAPLNHAPVGADLETVRTFVNKIVQTMHSAQWFDDAPSWTVTVAVLYMIATLIEFGAFHRKTKLGDSQIYVPDFEQLLPVLQLVFDVIGYTHARHEYTSTVVDAKAHALSILNLVTY